jgi:uncharacterized protein YyaL (SSP411 family)
MLGALDRALSAPVDVVVAGDPGEDRAVELRQAAASVFAPDLVIGACGSPSALETWPLFAGKQPLAGAPTAYVCRGYACQAPTHDPGKVAQQVAALETQPS